MKYIQYDPAEFDKITVAKADDIDDLKACIAELEAENTKFRAMYNDLQLTTAYNAGFEKGVKHQKNAQVAEAALENKND